MAAASSGRSPIAIKALRIGWTTSGSALKTDPTTNPAKVKASVRSPQRDASRPPAPAGRARPADRSQAPVAARRSSPQPHTKWSFASHQVSGVPTIKRITVVMPASPLRRAAKPPSALMPQSAAMTGAKGYSSSASNVRGCWCRLRRLHLAYASGCASRPAT